jgi:hypothetical protein
LIQPSLSQSIYLRFLRMKKKFQKLIEFI